ncbi:MAG: hypothetical protein ACJ8DZ_14060 [Allosphingosinicella sp.]
MAESLKSGDTSIDVIIADFEQFTRGEVIALSLNIDANLRSSPPLGTPVDTGWARANWLPSIGAPAAVDSSKRDPTPLDISARVQLADQGRNDVLSWRLTDGAIFTTNSVPYIEALNDGHSPQSPRGWVQTAIEKGIKQTYSAGASKAARNSRAAAGRASKARPK